MASLLDSLIIARSGVLTHQERMAVISHNIVNVHTPGYHRQRIVLGTNPPVEPSMLETRRWATGAGVRVLDVVSTFNRMKESVLLEQTPDAAYHATLAAALQDLVGLLSGTGDGTLAACFQGFWNAWHDVANRADNLALRNVLLERSARLADTLRGLAERLDTARNRIAGGTAPDMYGLVPNEVDAVNRITAELQSINARLAQTMAQVNTHDLEDRRRELLRQLSEKLAVTVNVDGAIMVDGQILVSADGTVRNTLAVTDTGSPIVLELLDAGGGSLGVVTVTGGTLGAWLDAAAIVESLRDRLDTLAHTLAQTVNALHQGGYDLAGEEGVAFFTGTDADGDGRMDADTLRVNALLYDPANPLLNRPDRVAAAATRYDDGPPPLPNVEDGAVALAIADLGRQPLAAIGGMTLGEYFDHALIALGSRAAEEAGLAEDSAAIVTVLLDSIQRESGVNLDEELIELLQAQRAYQASSRVLTAVDDLIEQVIHRMGAR